MGEIAKENVCFAGRASRPVIRVSLPWSHVAGGAKTYYFLEINTNCRQAVPSRADVALLFSGLSFCPKKQKNSKRRVSP